MSSNNECKLNGDENEVWSRVKISSLLEGSDYWFDEFEEYNMESEGTPLFKAEQLQKRFDRQKVVTEAIFDPKTRARRMSDFNKFPEYSPKDLSTCLALLVEECAEVIQACGKALRFGPQSFDPTLPPDRRETNTAWIQRELDDLEQAIKAARQKLAENENM